MRLVTAPAAALGCDWGRMPEGGVMPLAALVRVGDFAWMDQ